MLKPEGPDTDEMREKILVAAEQVIEGKGPQLIKVVDVARFMGISHTVLYRYFKTKADLRNALAERRLRAVAGTLRAIVEAPLPAAERIALWIEALHGQMQDQIESDRELFDTYKGLAASSRQIVLDHTRALTGQLTEIIQDGTHRGEFAVHDCARAAEAVFTATIRDHHPYFVINGHRPQPQGGPVLALMVAGMKAGAA